MDRFENRVEIEGAVFRAGQFELEKGLTLKGLILKASGLKSSYAIAEAKEVEARKFVKQGSERVTTSYGTFDTIKVVMKHDKPNRDTIFWLAPKLDYVPVKVSHQDGKTSYGLLLTGYKGSTN